MSRVEPVAEEPPSNGSHEILRKRKRERETREKNGDTGHVSIQEIYETGSDCREVKGNRTRNHPRVSQYTHIEARSRIKLIFLSLIVMILRVNFVNFNFYSVVQETKFHRLQLKMVI